jgi:preprotein translocase subunit SecA
VNPKINLLDQLVNVAKCSHLMLHICRNNRSKFMSKDSYKDIQSTIQNCFLVVKLFNIKDPTKKVYLYQLGTDELESLFGTLRTLTHSKNSDSLALKITNDVIRMLLLKRIHQ